MPDLTTNPPEQTAALPTNPPRLQIMRSMPDLTISPTDFAEFLEDVLAQPKLRPDGGEMRMTGSVQHIFPLRDWSKGGMVKLPKKRASGRAGRSVCPAGRAGGAGGRGSDAVLLFSRVDSIFGYFRAVEVSINSSIQDSRMLYRRSRFRISGLVRWRTRTVVANGSPVVG